MKDYFPGDAYDTPEDVRRFALDRFLFGNRWNLYFRFFGIVLSSKSLADKGLYDDEAWAEASLATIRAVEGCGGRFHIRGLDNIREVDGPAVFVSNHMSTLETAAFPVMIHPLKKISFVVKEGLVKGPFFGPIMRAVDPITVTRKDPRKDLTDVLTQGVEKLAGGRSIVVFPQSTRYYEFDPAKFNSLGIKLASRAGVPVIPVAIKTDFWSNGKIIRGFGPLRREEPIHIEFGKAVAVEGRGKAAHEAVVDFIADRMKRWNVPVAQGNLSEA